MIKKIIKKIIYRERASSESYINYLRKRGVQIGEHCTFHAPRTINIDVTQPFLIKIGNNVEFTGNIVVLCHDLAWSVFKNKTGEIIASNKSVEIGDNVFIGMHTVILRGVHVGNNVIIGAGTIITKDIPDNCVVAGNPAKVIMKLDDYYNKRKKNYISDAKEMVYKYYERYGSIPPKEIFRDYFPLFYDISNHMPSEYQKILNWGGSREQSLSVIAEQRKYSNYECFIEDTLKDRL